MTKNQLISQVKGARGTVLLALATLLAAPAAADLTAQGNQFLHRTNPEAQSELGYSLASGDFNGDGYADLAVGIPGEDVGPHLDAGRVRVFYGTAQGISAAGQQVFDQDILSQCGFLAGSENAFGYALAAGNFDGDAYDDLAIGVPFEDSSVFGLTDFGLVHVLIGSSTGLACCHWICLHQSNPDILDAGEDYDYFGRALATGDFDGDGYGDLVVGVPGENIGSAADAGAANVLYGSTAGLVVEGDQFWHQNVAGTQGGAELGDEFGHALAAADFDGDGHDDLAVGIHFEDLGALADAGAVHLLRGSEPGGLTATGDQIWHQNTSGVLDVAEEGDEFGFSLAAADFNDDGRDDLAVGVPREAISGWTWAGAVNALFGSPAGLTATGNQFWHQSVPGTAGAAEPGDLFGWALAAGDFDASGTAELAVGVAAEDLGGALDGAGAVHILCGADPGLAVAGNRIWHQNQPGVADQAESWDLFGAAVAVGDFDGNGVLDLAVGVPWEDIGAVVDAGAVQIFYGLPGIFTDGFESGDTSAWSGTVP